MKASVSRAPKAAPGSVKVLAVHRYYWPDTPPYASILKDIVHQWMCDGDDVEVLSTQPSYKRSARPPNRATRESVDGVVIRRVRLLQEHGRRWTVPINIVLFSVAVAWRIAASRRRFDVVMTSTAPPVVLAWAASRATRLRGGKFIYHCMDIHPEIGRVSGEFRSRVIFSLLQRLDRATCQSASAVVVLSKDMAETLQARDPRRAIRLHVINNFEIGQRSGGQTVAKTASTGRPLSIVFAGNIGRFQGLETIIRATAKMRPGRVKLTLMGDGSALDCLRDLAATAGGDVAFVSHQTVELARAAIASADLGLVSLTGGIHRFAYPSKTMTYLAEGCPILGILEKDCELALMLDEQGVGISVPPGNVDALASTLEWLVDHPDALQAMRAASRERGSAIFDKAATLKLWSELIRGISQPERVSWPHLT